MKHATENATQPQPAPLSLGDCARLYLPLGLTFVMVSGAAPIVSTGLRRVGDPSAADHALSAYALAFTLQLMVHAPLFVTREIVMTAAHDAAGWTKVGRFLLRIAAGLAAVDLTLALTPLGDAVLSLMSDDPSLVPEAKRCLLILSVLPLLITVRGLNQALLIRNDRSRWVGVGTGVRLLGMGVLLLVLVLFAPWLGAQAGAIAFACGIALETAAAIWHAAPDRRALAAAAPAAEEGSLSGFALPLMLGNLVGIAAMPFFAGVAGQSVAASSSIAAFTLVRTLAITCGAPAFALQALVTAKADSIANERKLAKFGTLAGLLLATVLACFTLPAVADLALIDLLNAPVGTLTYDLAISILPAAILLPVLVAGKAVMRGLLIRRRLTRHLLVATGAGLCLPMLWLALFGLGKSDLVVTDEAMAGWLGSVAIECIILCAVLRFAPRNQP